MWCFRSCCQMVSQVALGSLWATAWAAAPVQFRTTELPWAALGTDYHVAIQAQVDGRCPLSDLTLSVVDGFLPRGLSVQGDLLAGVPKEPGIFHFRVRAANGCGSAEADLQLLVTGKPILRVAPEELRFEYRSGDSAPKPQTLLVSSTWPEFAYSITTREPWLQVRLAEGVTPSADSAFAADAAKVQVVPKDLAPGWYETTLIVSGPQVATSPAIPVRLHVLASAKPQ